MIHDKKNIKVEAFVADFVISDKKTIRIAKSQTTNAFSYLKGLTNEHIILQERGSRGRMHD